MSVHQIIYTSCLRGINGVNDGQQIYSYDAALKETGIKELSSMFSYHPPALPNGVVMSEEIALTMPKAFSYRRFDSGVCALALNTYLGYDYMGKTGRFGNSLSHVIAFDPEDTGCYPAEYYASRMLRTRMEFEEVNNPNKPDYLPTPALERGFFVDIQAVTDFLSGDNRLDIYKNMLHAMLSFERERKRLVICDKPENIILWIAALEYALPLRSALNINFSTYEPDPSLSASQICGVVPEGTSFNSESRRHHFVFDLLSGQLPEFELEQEFYEFIDIAMSFSYESILDFHSFLCNGYRYERADERLYDAYSLYAIVSDGIGSTDFGRLNRALTFADEFSTEEETRRIFSSLISQHEALLQGDRRIFLRVIEFGLHHYSVLGPELTADLKETTVDRILIEFWRATASEQDFTALYDRINTLAFHCGFSTATELMKPRNREKLFEVMRQNMTPWKLSFIVTVISDYAKDQKLPLSQLLTDAPLGQIYYGIVRSVYTQDRQNGVLLVSKILEAFSSDCTYLVNMALNLEGMVLDLPNGEREAEDMWNRFGQLMLSCQSDHFDTAYSIFSEYRRYEQIFLLYTLAMCKATDPGHCRLVFQGHCHAFADTNPAYREQFFHQVLEAYFLRLTAFDATAAYEDKCCLLELLLNQKIRAAFADELIRDLVHPIPLEQPSAEHSELLQNIFNYSYNFRQQQINGKLLLLIIGLIIGMVLSGNGNRQRIQDKLEQLKKLTQDNQADLTRATEKHLQVYFDWLLPNVCELCDNTADLETVYELFELSPAAERMFFSQCAKLYLKQSKKDYTLFCQFLGAVFDKASPRSREELGKVLCKLSKQKLEELSKAVIEQFGGDKQAIQYWNEIRETAQSSSPLLNNLTSLFRRRKD